MELNNWQKYFTFAELQNFADRISRDEIGLPKHLYGKPSTILFLIQYGAEVGLPPMKSLITLIPMNGYVCMIGDAMMVLLKESGCLLDWTEDIKGEFEKDNYSITIKAKRQDADGQKWKETGSITKKLTQDMFVRAGMVIPKKKYERAKGTLTRSERIRYENPEQSMLYILRGWVMRDLWPDVFGLIRSFDEVRHYKNHEFRLSPDGNSIVKTKPSAELEAMESLNDSVIREISKNDAPTKQGHPLVMGDNTVIIKEKYTPGELDACKHFKFWFILNKIMETFGIHPKLLPGKNEFKKYKALILAHQLGEEGFMAYVKTTWPKEKKDRHSVYGKYITDVRGITKGQTQKVHVKVEFRDGNDLGIVIPDFEEGSNQREITDVGNILNEIREKLGVDDISFIDSLEGIPDADQYNNMVTFFRLAPRTIINTWINKNKR